MAERPLQAPSTRAGLGLAIGGALFSWTALITYFTVFIRWPDLRDSGHLNVALAGAGSAAALAGVWRCFRWKRWRITSAILALLSAAATAFLALYIYHFSYQLPDSAGVVTAGSPAPAFSLRDQEGRERTLAEFAGNPVVLVFFRGSW